MKALILDDEQHCVDTLEFLLKKYYPKITDTIFFFEPPRALNYLQNKI